MQTVLGALQSIHQSITIAGQGQFSYAMRVPVKLLASLAANLTSHQPELGCRFKT